jgi:hypothetical protein
MAMLDLTRLRLTQRKTERAAGTADGQMHYCLEAVSHRHEADDRIDFYLRLACYATDCGLRRQGGTRGHPNIRKRHTYGPMLVEVICESNVRDRCERTLSLAEVGPSNAPPYWLEYKKLPLAIGLVNRSPENQT